MDKTPAEAVAWARSVLEAVTDNAALHAENCPVCTNHWKCDTARYWADAGALASEKLAEAQQDARRAALAAR